MVLFLLGPYLWTCWCALQSPSFAGGLLQITIVMADCRGGLRVAVARVQIDVRIRCLSGFSRDHTAGVAWSDPAAPLVHFFLVQFFFTRPWPQPPPRPESGFLSGFLFIRIFIFPGFRSRRPSLLDCSDSDVAAIPIGPEKPRQRGRSAAPWRQSAMDPFFPFSTLTAAAKPPSCF
jgi:hypothetical protein